MIIVLKPRAKQDDITRVEQMVKRKGLDTHIVVGSEMTIIGCIGDTTPRWILSFSRLILPSTRSCTFRSHINLPTAPFIQRILSLMSREVKIGGGHLGLIAGPCSVESVDQVMEIALEAGADDVVADPDDGSIEVTCEPSAFDAVQKAFEAAGLEPEVAEITWKAQNETSLSGEDADKMQRLIDALEDLDDVQQVYTTAVFD